MQYRWSWIFLTILFLITKSGYSHSYLVSSKPQKDEKLEVSPKEIKLEFSGPIELQFSRFQLEARQGKSIRLNPRNTEAGQISKELVLEIPTALPAGIYKVSWNILSADGHRQRSHFEFQVK